MTDKTLGQWAVDTHAGIMNPPFFQGALVPAGLGITAPCRLSLLGIHKGMGHVPGIEISCVHRQSRIHIVPGILRKQSQISREKFPRPVSDHRSIDIALDGIRKIRTVIPGRMGDS